MSQFDLDIHVTEAPAVEQSIVNLTTVSAPAE